MIVFGLPLNADIETNCRYYLGMSRPEIHEQRRFQRRTYLEPGKIRFRGADGPIAVGCIVKDISAHGAQISVSEDQKFPPQFQLDAVGLPLQVCSVKWASNRQLGVEFA